VAKLVPFSTDQGSEEELLLVAARIVYHPVYVSWFMALCFSGNSKPGQDRSE
jgi:hypothetical protein